MENRWSWKWPDERLKHSFRNVGPIKYKIGEIRLHLKNLTFLGLHGIGLCGVKTKSAMQIMAKKNFDTCVTDKHVEILKVRVASYQIRGVGSSNQDQEVEKLQII